ncbi:MAG: succinate dehydrogenase, hydrophobic membrane anchor protein [Rhodospirillales bacterium]|nr:succinate dehydrogenase, hydrophobic membrane anchor protein [Rhodospirillales bacterium]MCB9979853.1 succinate dehydrogenase, hydrophobic membrane anchor protein [Rhodospirillales bacterium]
MKWDNTGLKTPEARVSGLGSAKSGVHHWMMQRVSAIAAVPLVIWIIWAICRYDFTSYMVFKGWVAEPVNAILLILLVISVFYHAVLGAQVVVEDYISREGLKFVKLISQRLFFFALGVACIFSILKLAFV